MRLPLTGCTADPRGRPGWVAASSAGLTWQPDTRAALSAPCVQAIHPSGHQWSPPPGNSRCEGAQHTAPHNRFTSASATAGSLQMPHESNEATTVRLPGTWYKDSIPTNKPTNQPTNPPKGSWGPRAVAHVDQLGPQKNFPESCECQAQRGSARATLWLTLFEPGNPRPLVAILSVAPHIALGEQLATLTLLCMSHQ